MSTVNPMIPLSGNSGFDVPDFIKAGQAGQQMRQQQAETQNKNAFLQLLADQRSYDAQGNLTPEAMRNTNALSPEWGLQAKRLQIDQHIEKLKEDAAKDEMKQSKLDFRAKVANATEKARQEALDTGASEERATGVAWRLRNQMLTDSGLLNPEEIQQATGTPYDPDAAKALARLMPGELPEERLTQQGKIAEVNLKLKDRQETDRYHEIMRGLSNH